MVVCITVTCVAAPTPGIEKNETCKSQHPLQGTNGLGRVPPLRRSGETSKPVKLEKKEREKGKKGGGGKRRRKKKKKKKREELEDVREPFRNGLFGTDLRAME